MDSSSRTFRSAVARVAFAILLAVLGGAFASAACPPATPLPPSPIPVSSLFAGMSPSFGNPVGPARFSLIDSALYQEFDCGHMAAYTHWPFATSGGGSGPATLTVRMDKEDAIVQWTGPATLGTFVLQHGEDTPKLIHEGPNQEMFSAIPGSGNGKHTFGGVKSTQTIGVRFKGCVTSANCNDHTFTSPAWLDIDPFVLPPPTPPPLAVDPHPPLIPGELDLYEPNDGDRLELQQRKALRDRLCSSGKFIADDEDDPHKGELESTRVLAMLEFVRDEPPGAKGCGGYDTSGMRNAVNKAILDSTVESQPGTDLSVAVRYLVPLFLGLFVTLVIASALAYLLDFFTAILGSLAAAVTMIVLLLVNADKPGDYDMKLQGILQISYRFENELWPDTKCHILGRLLTVHGAADELDEYLSFNVFPTPIRETENHVLMIQSARYLSNNLYKKWHSSCGKVKAWDDVDNDKNGMDQWWRATLQRLMQEDFYEFSSRVYAELSHQAIRNLFDFAAYQGISACQHSKGTTLTGEPKGFCDVRRAARNVLDYSAAKYAMSSDNFRRVNPFRRHMDERGYTRLLGRAGDPLSHMFLAYAAQSPLVDLQGRRLNQSIISSLLPVEQSTYLPSYVITDLMGDVTRAPYGAGGGGPNTANPVQWLQRFHATARGSSTAEIYYRETNFLISAGGKFDGGVGAAVLTEDEDAWPQPTTLMPTADGVDVRQLVRIQGSWEQDSRSNLCVTRGFACGLNPIVPAGIPDACVVVKGEWTFINFDTPPCPIDFGFYVAVLRKPCKDDGNEPCEGDDEPDSDEGNREDFDAGPAPRYSYGFFEATSYPRAFDVYIDEVLTKNPATKFGYGQDNRYHSPNGRVIDFYLGDDEQYPILGVAEPGEPFLKIERDYHKWPMAAGNVPEMVPGGSTARGGTVDSSEKFRGCVTVDNWRMKQRLLLDSSDVDNPKRARVLFPTHCHCPLIDSCLPQRLE